MRYIFFFFHEPTELTNLNSLKVAKRTNTVNFNLYSIILHYYFFFCGNFKFSIHNFDAEIYCTNKILLLFLSNLTNY